MDFAAGGGDFTSIQEAIEAVPTGAVLLIQPGTYRERIRIYKEVHLVGDGAQSDIIIGQAGN
jgi:pectin methylesterase-like acyl-CoA thioesterase